MNRTAPGCGVTAANGTGHSGDVNWPISHIGRSLVARWLPRIGQWSEGTGARAAGHLVRFRTPRWRGTVAPDQLRRGGLI